jgi:CHRD domain-containing protein
MFEMSRRRIALPLALAAAAVAATGVAAAVRHVQSTQAAAADFSAVTVTQSHTTACTASDGSYQDTTATYAGTATSSEARLNGALRIRARSVVNTTSKLGWLEGSWRVRGTTGGSNGTIRAAIAGGNLVGSIVGDGARPEARLVASISAAFGQGTGFAAGKLGSGSAAGAGVLFTRGDCRRARPQPTNFVFRLHLTPGQTVPRATNLDADAAGSITLDLTRDGAGTITGGTVVFYVNYRFHGAVTITGLALHQGARGTAGPVVLDAVVGTVADADGHGNLTKVVTTAPASLLQALLTTPRGYYLDLSTSANTTGALRAQLASPDRR